MAKSKKETARPTSRPKQSQHAGLVDAINRSQAVIEFHLDGTIAHANENFLDAMGYSLDEIVGKHHRMFVDPTYASSPEYTEFWNKLRRGEFAAGVFKRFAKGGREIHIQASYNPVLDASGKPVKVVKFATDCTEQVRQARMASAIEGSGTASMHIDRDCRITYANRATLQLVQKNLAAFEKQYPSVDFSNLIGQSIDVFHSNPSYQRKLLSDPRNLPHQAEIEVGGRKFALNISAMLDSEGNHIGSALEWQDVTSERAKETEAARLVSAIEGSATASMQINREFEITYANPATIRLVQENLAVFQREFPRADFSNLLGSSIDVFHKDPSFQRRILDDANNLPHKAEIEVGGHKFALNISAMRDRDGNHIGASLEWQDVTQQRRAETQQKLCNDQMTQLVASARQGDLTARADTSALEGEFRDLASGINEIVAMVEEALGQVNEVAVQVSQASGQIAEGSQKLAQGASQQASSVEEISASLEEMSSMTKQNADNASEAKNLANGAQESAVKGNATMEQMQEAMQAIKNSSDETAKIVKTIDEISFQTNMLALNAAVEAARAGDAGRGFAVVAEEVRSLAQRSAEAAKSTAQLIEASGRNADNGVAITESVQQILQEIRDGSTKVNDLIVEIAAASKEQADGLNQVATAVDEVNKVTQENSASSEESSAAAAQLNGQVDSLTELLRKFTLSGTTSHADPAPKPAAARKPQPQKAAAATKSHPTAQSVIPLDDDELADF